MQLIVHWVEYVPPDCDIIWRFTCLDRISIEAQNDIYFFRPRGSLKVSCLDSNYFAEIHCGLNVQMKVGMYLQLAWPLYACTNWRAWDLREKLDVNFFLVYVTHRVNGRTNYLSVDQDVYHVASIPSITMLDMPVTEHGKDFTWQVNIGQHASMFINSIKYAPSGTFPTLLWRASSGWAWLFRLKLTLTDFFNY